MKAKTLEDVYDFEDEEDIEETGPEDEDEEEFDEEEEEEIDEETGGDYDDNGTDLVRCIVASIIL